NLPGMGEAARRKLAAARVLVLGVDGAGAVAAHFLAGAGVGTIGILDDEEVAVSELHRQTLLTSSEVGSARVRAAQKRLNAVNPDCTTRMHVIGLTAHNAEEILGDYDLVIDGLTDWQTKLLASDACMQLDTPLIHGGVTGYRWQVYTMVPGKSACLRCVFHQLGMEDLSREQTDSAVHGPTAGMAGALQASEAIQVIAELGVTGSDELIQFDCLRREFYTVRELGPRADCPDCGRTP